MKMKFLVFSTLFSVALAQQLISISNFKGENQVNDFNVPTPYGIYVSATSDSTNALTNIFITQKDGSKMSLLQLKNRKLLQTSGTLQPWVVTDGAFLATTLTTNQLKALNGVIFLSSTAQLNNQNFYVIDAQSQNANFQGVYTDATFFFLNTNMGTNPYRSTVISNWKQDPNSLVYLYAGVPQDGPEPNNHQIFSNPMHTDKFDGYFSNVEKFSLASTVAFYLRTYKKGPSFRLEPGYFVVDRSTTTSTTTTGFYMKPANGIEPTITINTQKDNKYSGSTSANVVGSLPTGGRVSVVVNDGGLKYNDDTAPNDFFTPWSVPYIGQNIQISSTGGAQGVYYVQYCVVQGPANTGTTSRPITPYPGGPTLPGRIETTTKSSGTIQFLSAFIISMGFIGFL